jgi:hypothetical protein
MEYSEARGKMIREKNLRSKISCQSPFNEATERRKSTVKKDYLFPHPLPGCH